jgi:hypothetical protein
MDDIDDGHERLGTLRRRVATNARHGADPSLTQRSNNDT